MISKNENIIKMILKYLFLMVIGGMVYYTIEILYRGHSHISMFILGGLCFILCGLENKIFSWELKIEYQMFISALIITVLEFITGYIVNIVMGLNVWDYSNMPFNIMGQICLPFTVIWYFLSIVAIVVDDYLRYFLFNEEKPRYYSIFCK